MSLETGVRVAPGKRALDLLLLAPAAPLLALATGALALLVRVVDGGPALFCQPRAGLGGRPFRIYKLRTMTCEPDPRDRRPTRLGRWLRARGLDELPQLYNVWRGDMSLVGPRPLTPSDVERLCRLHPPFAERLKVPPGLTGLAQVCRASGPALTAALDSAYARERGVVMDLQILARTLWMNVVGKQRGAARAPSVRVAVAEPDAEGSA